jgi:glutamyl-tRNA synthetase
MEITHIIRGEEWVTSVPKHILIYRALGWNVPQMAHVPLILNRDKSKLSKRQGDVAVEDYLKKGYLREALINFMAFLGWNPGEGKEEEFFDMDSLIRSFTLEKVQSSGAVFNVDKLNWMNNAYIKNYDINKLVQLSLPYFQSAGFEVSDAVKTEKVLSAIRVYLNRLDEIPLHLKIFVQDEVNPESKELMDLLKAETSRKVFSALTDKLIKVDELNSENYKSSVKEVQTETGVKGKQIFKPLRIALTGSENGPELPAIAEILGKDKVISFLKRWT